MPKGTPFKVMVKVPEIYGECSCTLSSVQIASPTKLSALKSKTSLK